MNNLRERKMTWDEWMGHKISDDLMTIEWEHEVKKIYLKVADIAETIFKSKEFYEVLSRDLSEMALSHIRSEYDHESFVDDLCDRKLGKILEQLLENRRGK